MKSPGTLLLPGIFLVQKDEDGRQHLKYNENIYGFCIKCTLLFSNTAAAVENERRTELLTG